MAAAMAAAMAAPPFCNACFQERRGAAAAAAFCLTSCGHVLCRRCLPADKKDVCVICRVPCRIIMLSEEINSDIQSLFMRIDDLCRKYSKEVSQISQFQEKHRGHLLTYYRGKIAKLEGYWKATQQMQHTQHQQYLKPRYEAAPVPSSISVETPISSRVSCRSSRFSRMDFCQKSTLESVRSTPLRMSSRETPCMSQIGSSQNNKISISDVFGLGTPQQNRHTPASSLPEVTRCPINIADLLQKQHLGSTSLGKLLLQK